MIITKTGWQKNKNINHNTEEYQNIRNKKCWVKWPRTMGAVGYKMQTGTAYTRRHNQVAGIVYSNICATYGLDVPKFWWETPPKVSKTGPVVPTDSRYNTSNLCPAECSQLQSDIFLDTAIIVETLTNKKTSASEKQASGSSKNLVFNPIFLNVISLYHHLRHRPPNHPSFYQASFLCVDVCA